MKLLPLPLLLSMNALKFGVRRIVGVDYSYPTGEAESASLGPYLRYIYSLNLFSYILHFVGQFRSADGLLITPIASKRVQSLPQYDLSVKTRLIATSVYPVAFYGSELVPLGCSHVNQLRPQIVSALSSWFSSPTEQIEQKNPGDSNRGKNIPTLLARKKTNIPVFFPGSFPNKKRKQRNFGIQIF